jgi:exonuclease SbcD
MSFKLAHFADCHLEYRATRYMTSQNVNVREADGYLTFSKCITEAIDENVDAVLVAGDLFHTPHPSARSIIFAQRQLRRFSEANIPVYLLSGNHDVSDRSDEMSASKIVDDPSRRIYSHAEPYIKYEISPGIHLHLVSHHIYGEQDATMKQVIPVPGEVNILASHGSCIDPILKEKLHTEQSPREIVIPNTLLKDEDWSYTLLGHIHERGWVGKKNGKIFYNGSIIRRGFTDHESDLGRGWTLWTIDPSGKLTPEFKSVAQRPQVDFSLINASDVSSTDITERILTNLRRTQIEGTGLDLRTAPILRQRIVGITSAKYAALDWKAIENNSRHALQWGIRQIQDMDNEIKHEIRSLSNEEILNSGDVVQLYDQWVAKSVRLEETDSSLQERVSDQARKFVQIGQEKTLEIE